MSDEHQNPEVPPPSFWLRLARSRWLWLIGGLVFLCAGVWFLLFGRSGQNERSGTPIAKISFLRNKVEVRYGGEYDWRGTSPDFPLLNDDAVKTQDKSAAMIEFGPQSFVKVEENSLILIRQNPESGEESLEIERGDFEGTFVRPMLIKTKEGEVRVRPGESGLGRFEARLDDSGAGEIRMLEGVSEIRSGEKAVAVRSGEVAILKDFQAASVRRDIPPMVVGPPDRGTVQMGADGEPRVQFKFGEPGKKYAIEVGTAPRFSTATIAETVSGGTYESSTLKEGTYYWRVAEIRADGTRGAFTTPRRLSLELPREFSAPERGTSMESLVPSMVIVDGADQVRIIRGTATLKGPASGGIREGDRVKMIEGGEALLSLGGDRRVRLLEETDFLVRKLKVDPNGSLRSDLQLDQGALLLQLKQGAGSEQVLVLNGTTYRFANDDARGSQSEVLITRGADGTIQMRVLSGGVQAKAGSKDLSIATLETVRVTKAGTIQAAVKEDVVDLLLREGVEAKVFYSTGLTLVGFEWTDRGQESEFQLASDESFRTLVNRQRVSKNRAVTAVPGSGLFFWRYLSGGVASPVTRVGFFPAKDARTGEFKVTVEKNEERIVFGSQPPVLTFRWAAVPGIGKYHLEVFREPGRKGRIYDREVAGASEITFFADFLGEGDFYWDVEAIDHLGKVAQQLPLRRLRMDRNPLAPMVDILYPETTLTTTERALVARGMLFSDGELTVNGQPVRSGKPGPFTVRLDLKDGINPIVFKEVGKDQKVSYYLRKIILEGGGRSP